MLITEIKKVGKTNKFKVYVDNDFFATLMDEDIVKNNISSGQEFEEETLKQIAFEGQKGVALDGALKLLSTYSKTEKELKKYLKDKGFTEEVSCYVLSKLKEYNYINDEAYADMFIKANMHKKGRRAISYELKQKGVSENIINKKTSIIKNQENTCLELAKKQIKNKPLDEKTKQKLFRHLLSKGFDYDDIYIVISKIFKGEENENW